MENPEQPIISQEALSNETLKTGADLDKEESKSIKEILDVNAPIAKEKLARKLEKTVIPPESLVKFKKNIEQMSDSFVLLDRVLSNRSSDRLDELLDNYSIRRMSLVMRKLCEVDIEKEQNFEEISKYFVELRKGIENIGTKRSGSNINEDMDSLGSVARALMMFGESAQDIAKLLKSMDTEETLIAARQATKLVDELSYRRSFILKLKNRIADYFER